MEIGHIKTEKMKKINPVLARKLNKMFEKIREFIKITKGVSKKIVKKDKISTSYDRTKDSFRQLTKFDLTVSVKILRYLSTFPCKCNSKFNKQLNSYDLLLIISVWRL